jgi:hypothetical protein
MSEREPWQPDEPTDGTAFDGDMSAVPEHIQEHIRNFKLPEGLQLYRVRSEAFVAAPNKALAALSLSMVAPQAVGVIGFAVLPQIDECSRPPLSVEDVVENFIEERFYCANCGAPKPSLVGCRKCGEMVTNGEIEGFKRQGPPE